jgi:hypothetical protein
MKFIYSLLCCLLIGCASVLPVDTPEKQLAAFEISFQEVVKTVILYRREGRISDVELIDVKLRVNEINTTLNLAYRLLSGGDYVGTENALIKVQNMLSVLRNLLLEKEQYERIKFNFNYRSAKPFTIYYGEVANFTSASCCRESKYYKGRIRKVTF